MSNEMGARPLHREPDLDQIPPEQAPSTGDQLRELDQRVRAFVNEHPVGAVVAAVGIGFLVARWIAR